MSPAQRNPVDGNSHRHPVGVDPCDLQRRNFDLRLPGRALGDLEMPQAQPSGGQLEHAFPCGKIDVVMPVQGQRSRGDVRAEQRAIVGRVFRQINVLQAEITRRLEGIGGKRAVPCELLARLGHRLEAIRRSALAGGAKLRKREAERTDNRAKRLWTGVVGKVEAGIRDSETADADRPRGLRRARGGGRSRTVLGDQIGEVERAVVVDHHLRAETVERDLAQDPVAGERCERAELHVEALPSEKRPGSSPLPNLEIIQCDRQRVGIHPHAAKDDGAAEFSRQPLLKLRLHDQRQNEESGDREQHEQRAGNPERAPDAHHQLDRDHDGIIIAAESEEANARPTRQR